MVVCFSYIYRYYLRRNTILLLCYFYYYYNCVKIRSKDWWEEEDEEGREKYDDCDVFEWKKKKTNDFLIAHNIRGRDNNNNDIRLRAISYIYARINKTTVFILDTMQDARSIYVAVARNSSSLFVAASSHMCARVCFVEINMMRAS